MPKITKRTVDALVPAERERIVWDDAIKGFGVRVHPTGRKVYIVKYRHEGRSVKVTIGPHGPVTPAAARAKAAEIVTLAKTGRDVAGKTPRARGRATVADLAQRFLEEYAPAHLKPGTARLYRKILKNRILPPLRQAPRQRYRQERRPGSSPRHAGRSRPCEPDTERSLAHADPGRGLGDAARGRQPVPVRQDVSRAQAREVSVR